MTLCIGKVSIDEMPNGPFIIVQKKIRNILLEMNTSVKVSSSQARERTDV
jgi:hypothetical protein